MIKKFTLAMFVALTASALTQAGNYVIPCNESSGVEILQDGVFDRLNQNIGNCSENTRVYLGEVDFGTDGDKYLATGIVLGNGWYVDGWAVLHAGATYESSTPFTQMAINETGGYQHYLTFAANMAYNAEADSLLSGGGPAMEGITYTKPTGKQKVWLTFVGGSGNIRSIVFYDKALQPSDLVSNPDDYNYGIRLLDPNERPGYELISLKIYSIDSEPVTPIGEGTDFPDTRIDTTATAQNAWGWTHEGFIADYGMVDFGAGDYLQMVCYLTHWAANIYDYLEFYLDEVNESNLFMTFWSGLDLGNNGPYPFAKNLPIIRGQHRILVKWRGGSTNLQAVEFVEQALWQQHPDCGIVLEDVEPAPDAFHHTFVGCPEGMGDPWTYEVKCKGRYESAGNIGYTGNGTVINFFGENGGGDGVDFGEGGWKRIIVNHSSEPSWIGDVDRSNFSFYLDLDPDYIYTPEDWEQNLPAILEGHEPIAVVRLQGTGAWSVAKRTAGQFLVDVKGKHELFMVYNTPDGNTGANVFDIYLDKYEDAPGVRGDLNGDGVVDIEDLNLAINIMLGKQEKTNAADINDDGVVDIDDVNILINIMLGKA
ncbi:MAG: T9SS C-terminal target domain-containing protein [Muribaculaceae bacterium]|nr:T9SS C-terminal target domain-containing protein [Muribaculaceae bacterium]